MALFIHIIIGSDKYIKNGPKQQSYIEHAELGGLLGHIASKTGNYRFLNFIRKKINN